MLRDSIYSGLDHSKQHAFSKPGVKPIQFTSLKTFQTAHNSKSSSAFGNGMTFFGNNQMQSFSQDDKDEGEPE